MKKLKPVPIITSHGLKAQIHLVGGPRPYLHVNVLGYGGYIPDRSVKRLSKMIKYCLNGKRKVKK